MKQNYQRLLDETIRDLEKTNRVPTLFLHSCCAPCSSYVLEYLTQYFSITVFYYNPNITGETEYRHRVEEEKRLIASMPARYPVSFVEGTYDPSVFYAASRGLEHEPEGGERCRSCYRLRLKETARLAALGGFDYMTTTLTISPLKHADWLNDIGAEEALAAGSTWLYSDFKKRGGYQRSIELSKEYGLYRQNYCGCIYSRVEQEERVRQRTQENQ